jgi:hypothetical protein
LGPFGSLDEACRAADRFIAEIVRHAWPVVHATQTEDVADKDEK